MASRRSLNNRDDSHNLHRPRALPTNVLFAVIKNRRDLRSIIHQVDDRHINAENNFKNSVFHYAVQVYEDDLGDIELLLRHGAKVNTQNRKGETPLHWAIKNENCNPDLVQSILENDGNPNIQNNLGETPLHILIKEIHNVPDSDLETLKLLLEKNADPNIPDSQGATPLKLAFGKHVLYRPFNWKIIIELIQKGGDINLTLLNFSLLHLAIIWKTELSIINQIIKRKPSLIQIVDGFHNTPLHVAMKKNSRMNIIIFLLNKGADVNAKNMISDIPLHYPGKNSYSALATLVKCGSDVNAVNNQGNTPLLEAVNCRLDPFNLTAVIAFLELGADVNVRDSRNKTPIYYAKTKCKENFDIIKLLLEYGADPNQMTSYKKPILNCSNDNLAKFVIPFLVLRNFNDKKLLKKPNKVVNLKFYSRDKRRFKRYSALRDSCMSELMEMQKDKVDHQYSLYQYIFDNCTQPRISIDNYPLIIGNLLNSENKYPCSKDLILTSMKRSKLLEYLRFLVVYMNNEGESVILDYYSVCSVAKFLTKSGLLKLIKVYSSHKY